MKRIVAISLLICSGAVFGCINDIECGYGNKCIKAEGNVGIEGMCVTPTDQFGNRDYSYNPPSSQPREVQGCQFNTDCQIGYSCMKRDGDLYGLCVK